MVTKQHGFFSVVVLCSILGLAGAVKACTESADELKRQAGITWGDDDGRIQVGVKAFRGAESRNAMAVFYARNTSKDALTVDACPPFFNKSSFSLFGRGGKVIKSFGYDVFKRYSLDMPSNVVRSWRRSISNSVIGELLMQLKDGRYSLTWQLLKAESPPLYLCVHGDRVTIYKDRWKTVKFTFRVETQKKCK